MITLPRTVRIWARCSLHCQGRRCPERAFYTVVSSIWECWDVIVEYRARLGGNECRTALYWTADLPAPEEIVRVLVDGRPVYFSQRITDYEKANPLVGPVDDCPF